jgi:hypothetical protein
MLSSFSFRAELAGRSRKGFAVLMLRNTNTKRYFSQEKGDGKQLRRTPVSQNPPNERNRDLSPVIFVSSVTTESSFVAGVAIAAVDAHDSGLRTISRAIYNPCVFPPRHQIVRHFLEISGYHEVVE